MDKKVILSIMALILLSSSVSAVSNYEGFTSPELMTYCVQANVNNQTGEVKLKVNVDMDDESFTRRDCVSGSLFSYPLSRKIWLRSKDITALRAARLGTIFLIPKGMSDPYSMFFSNELAYQSVFQTTSGSKIKSPQDMVKPQTGILSSPLNTINSHLQYDLSSNGKVLAEDVGFYYALAKEDINGMDNFYTGSLASQESFEDELGYGYGPDDLSDDIIIRGGTFITAQGNRTVFKRPGEPCGGSNWCINENKMDQVSPVSAGLLAFSDDLNYYYYPYYIDRMDVSVKGYSSNTSSVETYARSFTIKPTSNEVRLGTTQTMLGGFVDANPVPIKIIDVPNLGTKMIYDNKLTNVPSTSKYVVVKTTTYFKPNPLYRQKSPVDIAYEDFIFGGSTGSASTCNLVTSQSLGISSGLCEGKKYTTWMYNSTFTFNRPTNTNNAPPRNDSQIDDPAPPSNGGGGNGGGQTGQDPGPANSPSLEGNGTNITDIGWNPLPSTGGSLENQIVFFTEKENQEVKNSTFMTIQDIAMVIFELFVILYTLAAFVVVVYAFLIAVPSSIRKTIAEFNKLTRRKWK